MKMVKSKFVMSCLCFGLLACNADDNKTGELYHHHNNNDPTNTDSQKEKINFSEECLSQDEKMPEARKIVNGTRDNTLYKISAKQKKAIGALIKDVEGLWYNMCTATVIAPQVLITAAHCVSDEGELFESDKMLFAIGDDVAFANGEYDDIKDHLGIDLFEIDEMFFNPKYDGWDSSNDEGIIILKDDITALVPDLLPIAINTDPIDETFVGTMMQNVGYGATDPTFREFDSPAYYETEDEFWAAYDAYFNTARWWTTEPVISVANGFYTVYGNRESSVCDGDSGGPGLYRGADGVLRVMGTVSGGDESCTEEDEFARPDYNLEWIKSVAGDLLDMEISPLSCGDLDWAGICNGDVAEWCEDSQRKSRDCSKCGQRCGASDSLGNYCR